MEEKAKERTRIKIKVTVSTPSILQEEFFRRDWGLDLNTFVEKQLFVSPKEWISELEVDLRRIFGLGKYILFVDNWN